MTLPQQLGGLGEPAPDAGPAALSAAPGAGGQVLYRKYRPQTLAEVVGQEPIIRTLLNALASGRVAHAYLFSGPRGTGKTSTGRILAKAVNCLTSEGKGEPCNRCESCRAIAEGRALDLVEIDAASNRRIEDSRNLLERIRFAPTAARYKVYIVDEVHMLTPEAFNSLLKTLEEPPPHAIFVLATTDAHRVPATILSRCQRFDFKRITPGAVVPRLQQVAIQEGIAIEEAALRLLARASGGSLRDALNLLQQAATFYGGQATTAQVEEMLGLVRDERVPNLVRQLLTGPLAEGLATLKSVADDGLDLRLFQRQLLEHLRLLLLVKSGAGEAADLAEDERRALEDLARATTLPHILDALRLCSQADLRQDAYSSLPLELALAEAVTAREQPQTARVRPSAAEPAPSPAHRPAGEPRPQFRPATAAPPPRRVAPSASAQPPAHQEQTAATQRESVPGAAGVVPPAAGLEGLKARWREVVDASRGIKRNLDAILRGACEPVGLEEGVVILGFFPNRQFHRTELEKPENTRALEQALAQVTGQPLRVKCAKDIIPRAPGPRRHLIDAATQELGAVVLDEPESPPATP